jgi:hypothetical protein
LRSYTPVATGQSADYPIKRNEAMNKADNSIQSSSTGKDWQRTEKGNVARVSVIVKLTMLGVLKFATMDPLGMGIEMEGR